MNKIKWKVYQLDLQNVDWVQCYYKQAVQV